MRPYFLDVEMQYISEVLRQTAEQGIEAQTECNAHNGKRIQRKTLRK